MRILLSNSHYETDFGVSSAKGAGNTKIGFLKACRRQAFKKSIFIMRIADLLLSKNPEQVDELIRQLEHQHR